MFNGAAAGWGNDNAISVMADWLRPAISALVVGCGIWWTAGAAGAPVVDLDVPTVAKRGDVVPVLGDLRFKSKDAGTVPVIVGLRMRHSPDAVLARESQASQRTRIAELQQALLAELPDQDLRNVKRFRYSPFLAATVTPEGLERLINSEQVTSIEEDVAFAPLLVQSGPLVNADKAWSAGFDGTGWAVAILDTGVQRDHPFLAGKVVEEACFSSSDAANSLESLCPNGQNQQTGTGAAAPCASDCEHGTHVAGIAAGQSSSFSGIAKGASIIAIQVFSRYTSAAQCSPNPAPCVRSYTSDQKLALEYLYSIRSQFRIASVNMSLGGRKSSTYCDAWPLRPAIDNLRSAGIATVIASGNEGYVDGISFPACVSSAISVGATFDAEGESNVCNGYDGGSSSVNEVACFSNSASILGLMAPGIWIRSSVPGGGHQSLRGTSMAAPHVAGCWAILKQSQPGASVDQVEQVLKATGLPVRDWRNGITKPRLDCKAALDSLVPRQGTNAPDLQISALSVTPVNAIAGEQIDLSATVRNAGSVASGSTTLNYYLSADATISMSDTLLCSQSLASLDGGISASSQRCVTNAPTAAGNSYYGACVATVSNESDTNNNCSVAQLVTVSTSGKPDLMVSSVSAGSSATVGGLLSLSARMTNRGTASAAASQLRFYLSADTVVTAGDTLIGACGVPVVAAGATNSDCTGAIIVPAAVQPGSYYLGVIADATGVVTESDETNNSAVASNPTVIANTVPVSSLADAVDNGGLTFTTGGDASWARQTGVYVNDWDSARSGTVSNNQFSYMQTTAVGPGTLSFKWKVSSEKDYDGLAVLLDDTLIDYISGEVDWMPVTVNIPVGTHTVIWAYIKDESIAFGQDAGWVDQVVFTPSTGSTLMVSKVGNGYGTIRSSPEGIDCGASCSAGYAAGTQVTLVPRPDRGYFFAGWSGACTGLSSCVVPMNAAASVTAAFTTADDAFPPLRGFPAGWNFSPDGSNVPWTVTSGTANGGLYSLRSGAITDNQASIITFSGDFKEGYVRFALKISSEAGYDGAGFFIDDQLQEVTSGEYDWATVTYPISAGSHTLTWLYVKDGYLTSGQDAVWIDSVSLPLVSAGVGVLGTPVKDSTVSGVGVISGYHCTSRDIEVFVDGVSLGKAGAGTTLLGTQGVCGRTDTGYSLLYAFNNLINGQHVVTVTADGLPFDSHMVTTFQSGGQPWLSGANKTVMVPDFPAVGNTATLQWMESYQNFLITGISSGSSVPAFSDKAATAETSFPTGTGGVLGTPGEGLTISGVGVISGYHCTSKNIEVFIDGVSLGKAGAGTTLLGTQGICGRTDTGYSLLYAFNNLANGQHRISVTADGVPFDSHTVTTFRSGGVPWLSGVSRSVSVPGFPHAGRTARLQWIESYQNFLITDVSAP